MSLGPEVRELEIPWALLKREVQDSGCYLQVLHLPAEGNLAPGSSESLPFRKGYYVHVGSASTELSRQLQSARRKPGQGNSRRSNELDSLKTVADANIVIPIRTRDPLEAELIDALSQIADWTVSASGMLKDAGKSHLFGFNDHPLHQRIFVKLLLDFRINRLEKYLPDIQV
jgi:sugar fermentation stimulation protein A